MFKYLSTPKKELRRQKYWVIVNACFFVIHVTFRARLTMLFNIIIYILTKKEKKNQGPIYST
jgi:hypothetical protein